MKPQQNKELASRRWSAFNMLRLQSNRSMLSDD
jgi:hypothetical protein